MDATTISALVIAGLAVLGTLSSVLLLAFRVGTLIGKVTSFMEMSASDRKSLHESVDRVKIRLEDHIIAHQGTP